MDRLSTIAASSSQDNSRLVCETESQETLLCPNPFAANPPEVLECAEPLEETDRQEFKRLTQSRFTPSPFPLPRGERVGERVTGDDIALGAVVLGGGFLLGGPVGLGVGALLLAGCSGRSADFDERPSLVANRAEGFQRIIRSDAYAGRLVVFLESGDQVNVLNEAVRNYLGVKIERSVSRTAEEENRRRQELEARTGKKFLDWNRVYYVEARDKATAERLQTELMGAEGVRLVYPEQIKHGPSLATTPNLEGLQTYLEGSASAGLNITYAWDQGVYGAGVIVANQEEGLNFDHEEFDLSRGSVASGGNNWYTQCWPDRVGVSPFWCEEEAVAHGTATMGIIHAQHGPFEDRHGMRGMAPNAFAIAGSPFDFGSIPNGAIQLFECANEYSWDGTVTCNEGASGTACVPCVATPTTYQNIREALASDGIVFMPAGNGAIDLDETELIGDAAMEEICGGPADDPSAADCWESSGVILVGASQGDRDMVSGQPQKQSYSNCGSDVELYGWGERVVTTTWHPESGPLENYDWVDDGETSDPPNDEVNAFFTNQFGGTSAAAAMVAGAAALVQSYFCDIADGTPPGDGLDAGFENIYGIILGTCRYLTPSRMKQILVDDSVGIEAYADDGCPIGKQPNMEEAFRLTSEFWENEVLVQFPELAADEPLTEERYDEMHALGVGLGVGDPSNPPIVVPPLDCGPQDGSYSQACMDEEIVPHLSKKMDIDEDGRGDLVSWTRGEWKIDLSRGGLGSTGDNYGAWDVTLTYPPVSDWEIPVVQDYDSDGKADFAIYDRENGRWNIALTSAAMLSGEWSGWTYSIDWPGVGDSSDYEDIWYTRPLPADYNGDDWTDLAVQTSDGHWKMNFNWRNVEDGWYGRRFEEYGPLIPSYADSAGIKDLAYLSEEELEAYPGWAYLPVAGNSSTGFYLNWRGPGGDVMSLNPRGDIRFNLSELGALPLGGIENQPIIGDFGNGDLGVKTHDGFWRYYSSAGATLEPEPNGVFGNSDCKPVVADLDGDSLDDRTVMCADEWRIVYSASTFASQNGEDGVRRIPLGYTDPSTLPGQPVFGGLSYERVEQVRDYMYNLGLTNIPPLFDYAMTPYEYCDLPWFVSEMPEECQ